MQLATGTSFKLVAPSLCGPNGVLSIPKRDVPSARSSSRKSCANGEPSKRSLLTMGWHSLLHSTGLCDASVFNTYESQLTIHKRKALSNSNTVQFESPLLKPVKGTRQSGPQSCLMCSGPIK